MSLHESLRLYIAPDAYSLVGESDKGETLHIDRNNGQLSIFPGSNAPAKFDKEMQVFGLFGIVTLLKSDYLVVITKRTKVARVFTTPIYSATDFAVFPIDRSTTAALLANVNEAYLLGLLKSHLFSAPFYFTYGGYDLTRKLQWQQANQTGKPLWEAADDRFFWNRHLQQPLIDMTTSSSAKDCSRFILPVVFGFLNFQTTTLSGRTVLFGLISRRSRQRAGTRYFSRGIDAEGNVSNFNETEQILLLDSHGSDAGGGVKGEIQFSFVQTRGSVPVFWAQIGNLRYVPDLKIMERPNAAEALARHFDQQVGLYGDQYVVNLVNQKGYEKPVKEYFERGIQALGNPRVHYTYFDFHHECKGLRFDRVSVLIDSLDEELHQQSYFYHDTTTSPTRPQHTQTSVVRTNCMDCLDRTNVVQSALAKWVLNNQLREAGVLSVKESIEEHPAFLSLFRNVWADNADVVSKAYSGTGALKTDYTRTGKRSTEGSLQDGVNSVIRYIKNNFLDGPRQDAYDLVSGAWIPRKGEEQSWIDERAPITRAAPFIILFAFFLFFLSFTVPNFLNDYVISARKVLLLSIFLVCFGFAHVSANGIDYVSMPRLVVLDEVLAYNGKGYESGRKGRPIRAAKAGKSSLKEKTRKDTVLPILSTQPATKLD
ncbi:inositol/phosphatidylinositol phosphatase [Pseudohyphozyma bogoriensis]|nr:inositol/phosphatidylinositol phosphatase [Pseudohyphozyma bogoriensis]